MSYSESAMAGVRDNGKRWKTTIRGVPRAIEAVSNGIDKETHLDIEMGLRLIHKAFEPHMSDDNCTCGEMEALEWFEHESPLYEIENGTLHEFRNEFDFRLNELYDFADYNRIWVEPTPPR